MEKLTNLPWVTENKWQNWDWIKVGWTLQYVFFFLYQAALSELRSSMKQQLQSCPFIPSKDPFDHNYTSQNSPFSYFLL